MEDIEHNLARDVQKYGELYNKSHKYFCHRERTQAIWKALSSIYKINAKAKWKEMIYYFRKEIRKENFSWDLYPHLRFLENLIQPKPQAAATEDINLEETNQTTEVVEEENEVSDDGIGDGLDKKSLSACNMAETLYKFAQEVEIYQELYDKEHRNFFDRKRKEIIWKSLSTKYKMDAKSKWTFMRKRFVKMKSTNQTNWHLYPYLRFLENHICQKPCDNKNYLQDPTEVLKQLRESVEEGDTENVNEPSWSDEETSTVKPSSSSLAIPSNKSSSNAIQLSRDEILYNFVQEVEKFGELYNKAHNHFCNFDRKDAIWRALSSKYNIDAKAKWHTMRERFSREKRKENSTWHLYPYLYFLENHIQHRQRRKGKNIDFELPIEMDNHESPSCSEEETSLLNPIDVNLNDTQSSHDSPKRKYPKRESTAIIHSPIDVLDEVPQKIIPESADDDESEDWHFLQSLKYKMRKMHDEEKTQFKVEMLLQAEKAVSNSKKNYSL